MEQVSAMIGNLRNMANDMGNDFGRHYLEDFWDFNAMNARDFNL